MSTFSSEISSAIAQLGYTHAEVAARLGVSQQTVSRWCNGENLPAFERLASIAEVVGLPLSQLEALFESALVAKFVTPSELSQRLVSQALQSVRTNEGEGCADLLAIP